MDPLNSTSTAFPALTLSQLKYRVRRLTRIFGLSREDSEDLTQSFLLQLVRARARHDPARASLEWYLRGVLDLAYWDACRTWRRASDERDLGGDGPVDEGPATPRTRQEQADREATLDVAACLERLSEDERALAVELMHKSASEIARERGCHRATVLRQARQLRNTFQSLNSNSPGPRNTSTTSTEGYGQKKAPRSRSTSTTRRA